VDPKTEAEVSGLAPQHRKKGLACPLLDINALNRRTPPKHWMIACGLQDIAADELVPEIVY